MRRPACPRWLGPEAPVELPNRIRALNPCTKLRETAVRRQRQGLAVLGLPPADRPGAPAPFAVRDAGAVPFRRLPGRGA